MILLSVTNCHNPFGWKLLKSNLGVQSEKRCRRSRMMLAAASFLVNHDPNENGLFRLLLSLFVNIIHHPPDVLDWGGFVQAVVQVEDMPGPSGGFHQHGIDMVLQLFPGNQQGHRVAIALDSAIETDFFPGRAQGHAEIDADHIPATGSNFLKIRESTRAEIDQRYSGGLKRSPRSD